MLPVVLDAPAGVGPIRAPAPDLGGEEHFGLVRLVAEAVMQGGDVLALNLPNRQFPYRGIGEQPHRVAVLRQRARLAMGRDVLPQEPAAEIGHARGRRSR